MITLFSSIFSITFVINELIVVAGILPTAVIIDADKGIVLQHIGTYSEKLEESILHIFIPYNNLCIDSPNSDVCMYIQSTNPNIVEVGTVIPYSDQMSTVNNRENISTTIQEDIQRVFLYHQVNKFIAKTKSILFFIDNNFYVTGSTSKSPMTTFTFSTDTSKRTLVYRATNQATLVLEQVFNNKVGYDFLTNEEIAELISLAVPTADDIFDKKNIKEGINMFANMIVGQSVYALKSCSIEQNEQSGSPPCLVVSTIFRRIPIGSSSFYQVYRLTPLPVLFKGEKYVYSHLPKIFGYNSIDKKVVIWSDDELSSTCIFSKIVQCRDYPISIPISTVPCLYELFGTEFSSTVSSCQVTKSKDNQIRILNIKHNIWYFYSSDHSFDCESQSIAGPFVDTISITEPMIVTLPCDRPVQCANIRLPSTACVNTTVILKSKYNNTMKKQSVPLILLNNVTNRLVSIYKMAAKNTLIDLQREIDTTEPLIKKLSERFGNLLLSVLTFILLSIVLFVTKVIKNKTNKQMGKLQTEINRIQRDHIQEL